MKLVATRLTDQRPMPREIVAEAEAFHVCFATDSYVIMDDKNRVVLETDPLGYGEWRLPAELMEKTTAYGSPKIRP